jgi:hypothetical protein
MLVESSFIPEFMDDELSVSYVGTKRPLSFDNSSMDDDILSVSKRSSSSLSPSLEYFDEDDLSADIAEALLPKRPNRYRDRRVKLTVRVIKSDIRRSYPQIMVNLCNMSDEVLFYKFLTTYAVPNLYSHQEIGRPQDAIIGYNINDMLSMMNMNMSEHPDRVTSIRSAQLRRRSDTDQSLLEVQTLMKYTNIQTMKQMENFMSMLMVMNKDKQIVALYCSGEYHDPVKAEESTAARINMIWNV